MSEWEETPTADLIAEVSTLLDAIDRDLDKVEARAGAVNDPVGLADFMSALRDIKAKAGHIYTECEQAYIANAPTKQVIDDVGLVEVKRKTTRKKWDHDEVFRSVVARIADEPGIFWDTETGEKLPPAAMAANLVARLREVLSPTWKVTGLRAMGLDPDEYAEVNEKAKGVKLPPRAA